MIWSVNFPQESNFNKEMADVAGKPILGLIGGYYWALGYKAGVKNPWKTSELPVSQISIHLLGHDRTLKRFCVPYFEKNEEALSIFHKQHEGSGIWASFLNCV